MMNHRTAHFRVIILSIFCLIVPLMAQNRSLNRHYDPIIRRGELISIIQDYKIAEWTAYKFAAATGEWVAVPFQIDEVDESGNYFKEADGILDQNDELVWMPGDAGDRATTSQWLQDSAAEKQVRIELELEEPDRAGEKAWLYLYKNITKPPEVPGYFRYIPAPDASGADTIISRSYKIAHNRKGWTDYLSLSNDYRLDLIDRIKFHIRTDPKFIGQSLPPIILTEDTLNFSTDKFYLRPVRSFQKVKAVINLQIPNFPFPIPQIDDTFIMPYFPYSSTIGAGFTVDGQTRTILIFLAMNKIRLSMDFNPGLTGMKFFSTNNPTGIPIDGIPDAPDTRVADPSGINWVMASGAYGSILEFFKFPDIPNSVQKLYYYDNKDARNSPLPDSTVVTGDGQSIGDMGLFLSGQSLIPASDSLFISFNAYYINESDRDANFANDLLRAIQNPLKIKVSVQRFTTSITGRPGQVPGDFHLYDAFPNPYKLHSENVVFSFRLGAVDSRAELLIFNLLGQEIVRFQIHKPAMTTNDMKITWNGRSGDGEAVPGGVYFYRLITTTQTRTKKLVILN